MVRHASVGPDLSRSEWESDGTHVVGSIPAGMLLASGGPGSAFIPVDPTSLSRYAEIIFTFGDGLVAIDATEPDQWIEIPFNCSITSARLTADIAGDIVVDIWRSDYATYPPTVLGSIVASAPPSLSSAAKSESSLSGWTTSLARGNYIKTHVNSAATCKRVVLAIGVTTS